MILGAGDNQIVPFGIPAHISEVDIVVTYTDVLNNVYVTSSKATEVLSP